MRFESPIIIRQLLISDEISLKIPLGLSWSSKLPNSIQYIFESLYTFDLTRWKSNCVTRLNWCTCGYDCMTHSFSHPIVGCTIFYSLHTFTEMTSFKLTTCSILLAYFFFSAHSFRFKIVLISIEPFPKRIGNLKFDALFDSPKKKLANHPISLITLRDAFKYKLLISNEVKVWKRNGWWSYHDI